MILSVFKLMLAALASAVLVAPAQKPPEGAADRFWPQWRGPHATGVSTHATPPLEWSETKNVRWKIEIPGRGSASPVVWGDRLFVLTAIPVGASRSSASHAARRSAPRDLTEFVLLRDRSRDRTRSSGSGRRARRCRTRRRIRTTARGPRARRSPTASIVIAFFESFGLYAYDMNGTLVWQKDLGDKRMRNEFGEGTTPALHGNRLVVVWDHQGRLVHRRARQAHRQGDLARRARRDRHLGDAARRRARRPARRSSCQRHEPAAQLRPRDRRDRLGVGRASR